ncbi:DUF1272 domain-containing protein [Flavobacteriaceae bacterium]|jgi:hypothetical protein|nr:DUF1272 domain-containing protein [Flavobacteriaceae bacterium]
MLEIRPTCENCNKLLPVNSSHAMICSFECTFCQKCVENILQQVCPNCGGFEKRPIRLNILLEKYSVSTKINHKLVDIKSHLKRINQE